MANSSLTLSSLDFDALKQNFKQYLSTQSVFQDYNFEGSNINVLLDVLAYNTYLNSFYLNMVASEMFLDSAQKLDSVISHAKELNYIPRSNRSPRAVVSFALETTGINNPLIIEKGTQFTGSNANGAFSFVTATERSFLSANSLYAIDELVIFEGRYANDTFIVNYENESQRFILSDATIDTDSLEVVVNENGSNYIYKIAENLYNLNSNSQIFFLQSTPEQKYEIVFGDGVFGKRPINGSTVYASYRVTSGSDGNGISFFSLDDDIGFKNGGSAIVSNISVTTNSGSGANSEGIESIRYNAPRHFQRQSRCITSSDYETTILQNFPEIQYVSVFGGEVTNTSVDYGTVYISPSTYSRVILPETRKSDLQDYITNLAPIGVRVKIIDPDYLSVTLNSVIHVNFNDTVSTPVNILAKATTAVTNFDGANLRKFNTALRLSKLEQAINESDEGVVSNETTTRLFKTFSPAPTDNLAIFCDYQNPIVSGSVRSSEFFINNKRYVLTDRVPRSTPNGRLFLYELNPSTSNIVVGQVGLVDYAAGTVNVDALTYLDIGGGLKIFATPSNKDIYCRDNTIIEIDIVSGLSFRTVSE